MKILYSGGGTLGAVAPLLAVHDAWKNEPGYQGVWIGRINGKEQEFAAARGMKVYSIAEARLRHTESTTFSLTLLAFPWRFARAVWQCMQLLRKERPAAHVTAGSFVSGPVAIAAWLLGIPTVVHQQDLVVGLANKYMARLAAAVTVSVEESLPLFGRKAVLTGNPVRGDVLQGDPARARTRFGLRAEKPVLLVLGGSSGAERINGLVSEAKDELTKFVQVLHMTGSGTEQKEGDYIAVPFLKEEMADAYAVADVIVARAGFSTLTEVGVIGKSLLLIPIVRSHQEQNARYFLKKHAVEEAVQSMSAQEFTVRIRQLVQSPQRLQELAKNLHALFPQDAAQKVKQVIEKVARK